MCPFLHAVFNRLVLKLHFFSKKFFCFTNQLESTADRVVFVLTLYRISLLSLKFVFVLFICIPELVRFIPLLYCLCDWHSANAGRDLEMVAETMRFE